MAKGQPDGAGSTDYTAWMHLPEKGGWYLIARWKTMKTVKNLTGFHGFLENFNLSKGHLGGLFSNRWVRTVSGTWLPIQSAKFTIENTYNAKTYSGYWSCSKQSILTAKWGGVSMIVEPNSTFSVPNPQIAFVTDFDALP